MKLSDIIQTIRVKATRSLQGYTPAYWEASFGSLRQNAETKEAASEAVVKAVKEIIDNRHEEIIRWSNDGAVWILRYDGAWRYRIVRPGKETGGLCLTNAVTRGEALEQMTAHIEQYNAS